MSRLKAPAAAVTILLPAILLLSASAAMAQNPAGRAVMRACKPDIAKFCSQVQAGGGRVKACMKENIRELSDPCKEALFQAWLHQ